MLEEERPINSTGKYNLAQFEESKQVREDEDEYSDDFESYESDFESDTEEGFYQQDQPDVREQSRRSNQEQQLNEIVETY